MDPIAPRASGSPDRTHATHEKLIHFLAASPWSDAPVRAYAARHAVDAMTAHGPIRSWNVDDTGFLKQGKLSPGVQRQYTGSAGKTANCQIGVSFVLATGNAHATTDFQLYIPESWTQDRERCRRAYIPDDVEYTPKWCLALGMSVGELGVALQSELRTVTWRQGTKAVLRSLRSHPGGGRSR